ncbi:hypothetical protein LSH36_239g03020 [Paralvinella palmiformis]|uniref:Methyltransferase-like protein 9 n=1 Tax=Paralvinella palmiformis TaxID=53620 RepID=A0AAD9JLM1_9ANNE|nr:hypothetical protein LSH36_239g03020 [Paralvinella palmiformis]
MSGDISQACTTLPVRGYLARAMYNKMCEDTVERQRDHSSWYYIDEDQVPVELCEKFIQFHEDVETKKFLQSCFEKSDWMMTQLYHVIAKSLLSWFMNTTSINGLLKRGSMFVFSKSQFQSLLRIEQSWRGKSLLDLGAGDGKVTQIMAGHFEQVYVTEASTPMKWRLQDLGYKLLDISEWTKNKYDVISCLNLLDRCDKPVKILSDIQQSLEPNNGRALVAVVLPFRPYVEFSNHGNMPEQYLHIQGDSFESQVSNFVHDVLEPVGFVVEAFTRLPYLCEEDALVQTDQQKATTGGPVRDTPGMSVTMSPSSAVGRRRTGSAEKSHD